MDPVDVPVLALIVDSDEASAEALERALRGDNRVHHVERVATLEDAQRGLDSKRFNAVIIDPLSYGLDPASGFIFSIRQIRPEIVFVLFVDSREVNARRHEFYRDERTRFQHYYTLDKRAPLASFADEARAAISLCIDDLRLRMSAESLQSLKAAVQNLSSKQQSEVLPANFSSELERAICLVTPRPPEALPSQPKVFLSHHLSDTEYTDGLTQLLADYGFVVVVGTAMNTYVSQGVLRRITESDYFLCLMTRVHEKIDGNFATSSWILEEKGAALALQKKVVMLVEHGVDDIGGLQGDWQVIRFSPKGFLSAARQAAQQLQSYSGSRI